MSDGTIGTIAIVGFVVLWLIKENWEAFIALAYITSRIIFWLAIVVIGIYCLTRLL